MAWLRTRSLARVFPFTLAALATACATENGTTSDDDGSTSSGDGGASTTGMGGSGTTTGATTGKGGGSGDGGGNLQDYPLESEMNGTLGTANPLATDTLGFTASLPNANDIDIFKVDATVGASMRVAISDGNGGCPADAANVTLTIYDPSNAELATKVGICPELDGNSFPVLADLADAGTYFIRVTTTVPVSQCVVEISVSNAMCGDGVVQSGEQCDERGLDPGRRLRERLHRDPRLRRQQPPDR